MGNGCSRGKNKGSALMNPSQPINVVSGTATASAPELSLPNGNGPARRVSRGDDTYQQQARPATGGGGGIYGGRQIDYDALERESQREIYEAMKDNYFKNPSLFMTNLLLMSVQFFKNFDRDKEQIRKLKVDTENEMRENIAEFRMKPLVSDAMFYKILEYVGFRSKENDDVLEQLMPTEYLLASYFVETYRREDFERLANGSMEYSTLEQPNYRTCVEKAPNYGYAKLRCVDKFDDLVPDDTSSSQPSPWKPDSPIAVTRNGDIAENSNSSTQQQGIAGGKKMVLDPFPSVGDGKRREKKQPLVNLSQTVITEDEEEDEDGEAEHSSGMDFLRDLHGKLTNSNRTTPNMSARSGGGGGVRASPPLGGLAAGSGLRLQPQNANSDPVLTKQRSSPLPSPGVNVRSRAPPIPNGQLPPSPTLNVGEQEQQQQPTSNNNLLRPTSVDSPGSEEGYYLVTKSRNLQDAVALGLGFKVPKRNALPTRCFMKVETVISDDDDEDKAPDPYPVTDSDDKEDRIYLGSRPFMQHFATQFYEVAKRMGKGPLTNGARILDPKIMCHEEMEEEDSSSPFAKEASLHFVPSIDVAFFPDEAIDWYLKKRPKVRDKRTDTIYQWPSAEIVSQAQRIGFNLVPVGFVEPKRGRPSQKEIKEASTQWKIQFTNLEGLIQRNLNHPKIRCFLFALLLWKTHLESPNQPIVPMHIRHQFYWMVEKTPAQWTEENLGANLIRLLQAMKDSLRRQRLPNFFMSKENLYEPVPKHKLAKALERFHRFHENPVPFLMVAMKHLHCEKSFYPAVDIDKLYDILTTSETLALLNPQLLQVAGGGSKGKKADNVFQRGRLETDIKRAARADPAQERMRRAHLRKKEEERKASYRSEGSEKGDNGAIDMSLSLSVFEPSRGRLILEFFASHFIALARKSNEFKADGQCRLYLRMVENLLKLMRELKLDGTEHHMNLQEELEQLKQVSRATAQDYWNVNWASSRTVSVTSGAAAAAAANQNSLDDRIIPPPTSRRGSTSVQAEPLPDIPSPNPNPSPILGAKESDEQKEDEQPAAESSEKTESHESFSENEAMGTKEDDAQSQDEAEANSETQDGASVKSNDNSITDAEEQQYSGSNTTEIIAEVHEEVIPEAPAKSEPVSAPVKKPQTFMVAGINIMGSNILENTKL